jgi:hypothetical protein
VAHEEVVGQVSTPLRQEVFREYGILNVRGGDYEVDYLIAPGLGGVEAIRNFWPESSRSRTWNAYAKDALEEHLHQLVCPGDLDLSTAQRDIATDWLAAYSKYFYTDQPLALHLRLESVNALDAPGHHLSYQTVTQEVIRGLAREATDQFVFRNRPGSTIAENRSLPSAFRWPTGGPAAPKAR